MENPTEPRPAGYRITKVYTRQGDGGTTRLVGGHTVSKDHPRVAAYGAVDELQVVMGAAADALGALVATQTGTPLAANLRDHVAYLQNLLFTLGGELATRREDQWDGMPRVGAADVAAMENLIDALNSPLPPLQDFVLPGGHPAVTALHLCRVVCRRAEREVETLAQLEPVDSMDRPFLNRLSDLFFVMARALAHRLRAQGFAPEETIWRREMPLPPLPE
jgi:cob(I)alamin adenosyltransferase